MRSATSDAIYRGLFSYDHRVKVTAAIIASNGRVFRAAIADPARDWFAFRRLGTTAGKQQISCQSVFAGFSEERPFRELREARLVKPDKWRELATTIFEPPITVSDNLSLLAWLLLGGEALIERSIAEAHLAERLSPHEVGRVAGQGGFISTKSVPPGVLKHAPSKNLRLRVLLRDGRRCRVCGRGPDENVRASLDVHHGVGWGGRQSGLTVEENLFTVCSSCHDRLSPDLAQPLLASIGVHKFSGADGERQRYFDGVANYRRAMSDTLRKVAP